MRRLKEYFEQEERIKLAYIFGGFTRRNVVCGERHRCGCVCVPCIFIQRDNKIECECGANVAHICGCHSASGHRPCVQIELREGMPLKMKNDIHYTLISQAFSELQDLKISKMLVFHAFIFPCNEIASKCKGREDVIGDSLLSNHGGRRKCLR